MKSTFLLAFGLCTQLLMAQINDGGSQPQSQIMSIPNSNIPVFATANQDLRIETNNDKHNLYKIGKVLPMAVDFSAWRAQSVQTADGLVWRARIASQNAKAISLYFNNFKLPKGATMHIYSADYSRIIGGFSAHNNHESGLFSTEPLAGDELIIEYFEPRNAEFAGTFTLDGVGHIYEFERRGGRDFGDSESCQVNVNCSEGNGRTTSRDAVARILVKVGADLGWCSGTMVNNVAQDCAPYLLTAMHCGTTAADILTTTADINQWIFYFNYQSSTCLSPILEPSSQTLTGAVVRAHSNDGGGNTGSDFLLLELNNNPPSNYSVYYAGWRNSNTAAGSGYSIHHPAGDIKKISTFNSTAVSSAWGTAIGSHWEVGWVATANGTGVTEGGSSGSGLFNSSHELIGTLTGGSSSCQTLNGDDAYGKMSYHWASNGVTSARRLRDWLDPNNTGATSLAGTYAPCAVSVDRIAAQANNLRLFPNPTQTGIFNVVCDLDAQVQILDVLGRVVLTQIYESSTGVMAVDLSAQANGVYFATIKTQAGSTTKQVVLAR
jgi:hypothetical protein